MHTHGRENTEITEGPFIVVDVETTGSNPDSNRITEIALVTVSGNEIVSEYSSLVNPHQFIPRFIANMTGISNEMAATAPDAIKVYPRVSQILSHPGAVFVAHNARFDWGFITNTLQREGFPIENMPRLCTLKLARRLLPKSLKKNVGALAAYFGVEMRNRHRAFGDAEATAAILIELIEMARREHGIDNIHDLLVFQNKPIKNFKPPVRTYKRLEPVLNELPIDPGVYYFTDKKNAILYIGKAKSLRQRVNSYFRNGDTTSRKIAEMLKYAHGLRWTTTDSELEALLMESAEIKRHLPPYNTVAKHYRQFPFIKISNDTEFPVLEKTFVLDEDGADYFGPFRSNYMVDEILQTIDRQFRLRSCDQPIVYDENNRPCFYYQIERCGSPCSGKMTKTEYERELERVRFFLGGFSDGIITQLIRKMNEFADAEQFELADSLKHQITELRRLFARRENVPTSVNQNNVVVVIPGGGREKTADVFLIRHGKLAHFETLGIKQPLDQFAETLGHTYFNGNTAPLRFTPEDIDEIRIVNSWIYKYNTSGSFIYVEGKSPKALLSEFRQALRGEQPEE